MTDAARNVLELLDRFGSAAKLVYGANGFQIRIPVSQDVALLELLGQGLVTRKTDTLWEYKLTRKGREHIQALRSTREPSG